MTADELINILRQGEGIHVEFKSDFPENAQAIGKEMAALANSGGGVLLLGVSDDGAPTGIPQPEKAVERLAGIARTCGLAISPEIEKFQISKDIFIVYARIRPCAPCIYEGNIYHRVGSTSVKCNTAEQLLAIIESTAASVKDSDENDIGTKRNHGQPPRRRRTTEIEFFQRLTKHPQEAIAAQKILEWARKNDLQVKWEKSSFNPVLEYGERFSHNPITILSNKTPRVVIKFGRMKRRNKLSDVKLTALLNRLNRIEGVNLPANVVDKYPHIKLSTLTNEPALKAFLRCIKWTIDEVKAITPSD